MRMHLRRCVHHRPIAAFFLLAFLWTWGYASLVYLTVGESPGILVRGLVGAWGPLVAAGAVLWVVNGDLREWVGQVTKWRVAPRWYLFAVAIPVFWEDGLAVGVVHVLTGGAVEMFPSPWWHYVANFVVVFFLAGGLEEFGWRGFAQPRLQERYSALTAAVVIGVAWALWHLPHFFLFEASAYDPSGFVLSYVPHLVVEAVVLAWLYNSTGGSLLVPMVAHSLGNLPAIVTPVGNPGVLAQYVPEVITVALLVGLVATYGPAYLAASKPTPLIPGNARRSATDDD